ncbi:MAG: carbon storage regulator [Thermoguttaceae bacterium]
MPLARKAGQSVVIDGNIRVTVDRIRPRVVRLKVEAPKEIQVNREEVWHRRACEKPIRSGRSKTPLFRQSGKRLMGRNDDSTCSSTARSVILTDVR